VETGTKSVKPTRADELADAIASAARSSERLAIRGGGSKDDIGRPVRAAAVLDMTGFAGVIDYDPPELVLTVGAATPLCEVDALLASRGQALAFEPFDHGPIFGRAPGAATIGGVIAAGVAGPRRLSQGAARDHLLGFEAVSGRGERFVGGGKVVKNVTGYDLPKLMTGSWGRLAALTQVTLKVLPRAPMQLTKLVAGLEIPAALRLMAKAMGSKAEVKAAAHIPWSAKHDGRSVTALLLAGFPASLEARGRMIDALIDTQERLEPMEDAECAAFWHDMAVAASLGRARPLWRISVPASRAAMIGEALQLAPQDQLFDWAGGLVWIAYEGDAVRMRAAAEAAGGQAMLVRAPTAMRENVPALHPRLPGVAALEERVRRAFDPLGIFETGRF